ncbi:hypothetical protein PQR62_05430 [Herbaspirillum lusitanum]|uniref:Sel1 repeat family protein n=1 Tax=Herbaspirillum lusitanum TaxID=213312 RepID=A0ABW9A745_9BURK
MAAVITPAGPGAEAFEMVRTLVRDKTRFEPEDLLQTSGEDVQSALVLSASYALDAELKTADINGAHFHARSQDVRSDPATGVVPGAFADANDRVRIAQATLARQLAQADTAYNTIGNGIYLPAARRHWLLNTCAPCHGRGRVKCYTCHGSCNETCYECSGVGDVRCTAYGCYGGKTDCSYCNGRGHTTRSESYGETVNVATSVYRDGQYHTEYHTEYQTKYRQVQDPCYSCSFGKVNCSTCRGTSRVSCSRCIGSGQITCRTCSGKGKLICSPCAGSGEAGVAAWIDVNVTVAHALALPADVPDDVRRIADAAGPHGLAAISDSLALTQVNASPVHASSVQADYALLLRMVRLSVACNQTDYKLVAFGRPLDWLTLDDIVEDLLRQDLRALEQVLTQVADDGLLSSDVRALLEPLQAVAASEMNADVIESVLDGDAEQAHAVVVSADYAQAVRTAVLGALRHVYTRQAKRSWWQGAIAALVTDVSAWLYWTSAIGVLAGVAVTGISLVLFRRRMRQLLTQALGGANQADRAIQLATRQQRTRRADALILLPAWALLAGLYAVLPTYGVLSGHVAPSAAAATTITAKQRADVDAALRRYAINDKTAARQALEKLAAAGNAAAYGPYGWILLQGEGLTPREQQADGNATNAQARLLRAKPWIDKGLTQGDLWAKAAQAVSLLNTGNTQADREKALAQLESCAALGHGASMHYLAEAYLQGTTQVTRNIALARKWYGQAAELNQPADLYQLGVLEWQGAGGSRPDHAKAMSLWRRAAALGLPEAIRAVSTGKPV